MENKRVNNKGVIPNEAIRFTLDPDNKKLCISIQEGLILPELKVNDYCHNRVFSYTLHAGKNGITYRDWEECLYTIRILSNADLIFSKRVHLNTLAIEKIEDLK
jgi:hypothetical protein